MNTIIGLGYFLKGGHYYCPLPHWNVHQQGVWWAGQREGFRTSTAGFLTTAALTESSVGDNFGQTSLKHLMFTTLPQLPDNEETGPVSTAVSRPHQELADSTDFHQPF